MIYKCSVCGYEYDEEKEVFGMRVFFFIACRHIFESGSLYREIFRKGVSMDNLVPLVGALHDIVPYHGGGVLEHVSKKPFNDYLNRALADFQMPAR